MKDARPRPSPTISEISGSGILDEPSFCASYPQVYASLYLDGVDAKYQRDTIRRVSLRSKELHFKRKSLFKRGELFPVKYGMERSCV